jgi:hypothetical protein
VSRERLVGFCKVYWRRHNGGVGWNIRKEEVERKPGLFLRQDGSYQYMYCLGLG